MSLQSSAQAGQDLWVWEVTGHKTDGTFLDIGCGNLTQCNNTYALERQGWRGLLVDLTGHEEGIPERNSPFLAADATKLDWVSVLIAVGLPMRITYGSFDIDGGTADLIEKFPFDTVSFDVITVEHDLYHAGPEPKRRITDRLAKFGYVTICDDVKICIPGYNIDGPFETWLVAPELAAAAERFKCSGKYWNEIVGV